MTAGGRPASVHGLIDLRSDPDADLSLLVEGLRAGGAVVYPTETVYGLGGACTPEGVARVRSLKPRERDKPLIALVSNPAEAEALEWSDAARELASVFWPGAMTLILRDPECTFPVGVRHPETGAVAVRVSPHPTVARLLAALGGPLTSTSVNVPGEPPARSFDEAAEAVERLGAEGVWMMNEGTLPESAPSTVVDCTGPEPMVLREGAIPIPRLRCVIPEIHGHESK